MALFNDFIAVPTAEDDYDPAVISGGLEMPEIVQINEKCSIETPSQAFTANITNDFRLSDVIFSIDGGLGESENKLDLLYDSVAIHFNFNVFFRQLIVNLIWPFGIYLSPNMTAQYFCSTSKFALFYNHFLPMMVFLMIISYVMMSYTAAQTQFQHFQGSVWYPLIFFCLHRISVACKYASLSKTEYERYLGPHTTMAEIYMWTKQLQVHIYRLAIFIYML